MGKEERKPCVKQYKHQKQTSGSCRNCNRSRKKHRKVGESYKSSGERSKQVASSVGRICCKFEGVALDRAQTFYDEGIRSVGLHANQKKLLQPRRMLARN